ncbi:visual pigment-like receptor peropsin [Ylistrum balloti]|uniref:visual pigment-like receptor peropsin n=1 Tax=Ylistrum balloti TaxID=509963 RepID=UPI002905D3C5|nr:visual pigment-like receptor peropsin [Ylistrum balloti]
MDNNNTTNGSSVDLAPAFENMDTYYSVFAVMLFLTWMVGSFFNGSALLVFLKNKNLRTPTNMFVISLAMNDLGMSSVCLFAATASYAGKWTHGELMCTLEGFLVYVLGLTNLYLLCAISFDRYIVIAKPLKAKIISHSVALIAIVCCWIGGLFWSVLPFFGWNYYTLEGSNVSCGVSFAPNDPAIQSYLMCIFIFCFIIPLAVIIFCYNGVYMTIRNVARSGVWDMTSRVARKNLRVEKKMAKTIGCMLMVFVVAWVPYAIVSFYSAFVGPESLPAILIALPPIAAKCSAGLNPIVYSATNKQFRMAFYEFLPEGLKSTMIKKEEDALRSSSESEEDKKTTARKPNQVGPAEDGASQAVTAVEDLSPPQSQAVA